MVVKTTEAAAELARDPLEPVHLGQLNGFKATPSLAKIQVAQRKARPPSCDTELRLRLWFVSEVMRTYSAETERAST